MYAHSSETIVEEAGVQAGSFLFLTAYPASKVGRGYSGSLPFYLSSRHAFFLYVSSLSHCSVGLSSDCGISEKFQLNWKASAATVI